MVQVPPQNSFTKYGLQLRKKHSETHVECSVHEINTIVDKEEYFV